MTPERWRHIEQLYHAAREYGPEGREAFLSDACGADEPLKQHLGLLLAHDGGAGRVLDRPAAELLALSSDPPLAPGAQVGPYRIESLLGRGGMGQVYQAQDTRLGRSVAIKACSAEFDSRFHREARAAAALNHPNVCALYDIGPNYLVMELVEGATLAERAKGGPIALKSALRIASQIAEGLEAAHEKGVVHRDLKPANIKIKPDGTVKLIDFGVAQTSGPKAVGEATQPGFIVGTPAYMSPEQARGETLDKRTDIWAFGAVLYEMLTGSRAFRGDTAQDTLAAVLTSEPDWSLAPETVLPLLRRCLEKNPKARLRDIADARFFLELPADTRPRPARARSGWIASAAAILAVVAIGAVLGLTPREPAGHAARFTIAAPGGELAFPFFSAPALSPDGVRLVFAKTGPNGQRRLVVRSLDGLDEQPLPDTQSGYAPFWSPDGHSIGFFAEGRVKRIAIGEGAAKSLCDAKFGAGGTWNQDGTILFAPAFQGAGIRRVSAAGGPSLPVTTLDASRHDGFHVSPQFLPDGRHFLVFVGTSSTAPKTARSANWAAATGTYVGSLDGTGLTLLLPTENRAVYAQGYLLFPRGQTLVAQGFDAARQRLTGDLLQAADRVNMPLSIPGYVNLAAYSVGGTTVAFRPDPGGAEGNLLSFSRNGEAPEKLGQPGEYTSPSFSPDGKAVAYARRDPISRQRQIWLYDFRKSVASRFTFDPADDLNPVWSPDGRRIAFTSNRTGVRDIYVKDSSGVGEEKPVLVSPLPKNLEDWSPDGRYILFHQLAPDHPPELWAVAEGGGQQPFPVIVGPAPVQKGAFSPNGRYIAYVASEADGDQVYVQTFPPPGGKWQITTQGGTEPRWSSDGKQIIYAHGNAMLAVSVDFTGPRFDAGIARELFSFRPLDYGRNRCAGSPDGQHFVCAARGEGSQDSSITVIVNWLAGMKTGKQ